MPGQDLLSSIRVVEIACDKPAFLRAVLERKHHQVRRVIRRMLDPLDGDLYTPGTLNSPPRERPE